MTLLSWFLAYFPAIHGALALLPLLYGLSHSSTLFQAAGWVMVTALVLFVFPLVVFRVHQVFFPVEEGLSFLSTKNYSPWWGAHQIQGLFTTFPGLEGTLRLLPGAYSAWLRLWGSDIGAGVYWTPRVEIIDRNLVEIGAGVIFGHEVVMCSHMVTRRKESMRLYVKKIRIGNDCLVGALSELGPGTLIDHQVVLPVRTQGLPDQIFSLGEKRP